MRKKQETLNKLRSVVENRIILLEPYVNSKTRIKSKCVTCGFEWSPTGHSLLHGYGCPECGKKQAAAVKKWHVSQEQFLNKIPPDFLRKISVVGEYKHQHSKIDVVCKECGRKWKSTPYRLYRECGCEVCSRKRKGIESRKSHEEFVRQVFDVHDDVVEVLEKYSTGYHRIKTKCLQCGHIWKPMAQRLLRRGCPRCCDSKGERRIDKILKEGKIEYVREYTFPDLKSPDKGLLRFDFAILEDGVLSHLIEYDGKQHFEPVKYLGGNERFVKQKRNDQLKNEYCLKNNIRLLRVSYKEYKMLTLERLLWKQNKSYSFDVI